MSMVMSWITAATKGLLSTVMVQGHTLGLGTFSHALRHLNLGILGFPLQTRIVFVSS